MEIALPIRPRSDDKISPHIEVIRWEVSMPSAAEHLLKLELTGGWIVTEKLTKSASQTGSNFSRSYLAKRANGQNGFVKAFDFSRAFLPNIDTMAELQYLTQAYLFEREVLEHCAGRKLSNIVLAMEHGFVQVPDFGPMDGKVYFLIFELAEGDVRVQIDVKKRLNCVESVGVLKDVCLGLWQIHKEWIAHQDTKPSNVLVYRNGKSKVADFGRSSMRGRNSPHDGMSHAGDPTYAPPELIYGYTHSEFGPRRIGCDLYMLGNLAAFMFSGVNVTSLLFSKLSNEYRPNVWPGTYEEVIPILNNAFSEVLSDISSQMEQFAQETILPIISQLCAPDLTMRGHPKCIGRPDQYSLERYVSTLDLAAKKASIKMRLELIA